MRKLTNRIVTGLSVVALTLATSVALFGGHTHAIAWDPNSPGLDHPGFNVFTGVPDVGNEADFVRGRVTGTTNDFTDLVSANCSNGTQFSVRVYVHNGANQTLNNGGNGPAVAKNTKVKVDVPSSTSSQIRGTISASNAASVSDTLSVICNGKVMEMSYVAGSAVQQKMDGTTAALSDSIVTTGAPIGTNGPDGNMWGCFAQRVVVYLKVQVKEKPTPPPPVQVLKCESLNVVHLENHKFRFTAKGSVQNGATINGYVYNFGDGNSNTHNTNSAVDTIDHTYDKPGNYTAMVSVKGNVNGKDQIVTSDHCKVKVSIPESPVVPPTVTPVTPTPVTPASGSLPNTGAEGLFGLFAGTSAIGTVVHRFISRRFYKV